MPTMTTAQALDLIARVHELGPTFANRAAGHDTDDSFVADNFAGLKAHRFFSAGVPAELGGGDATHAELCDMLRTMARYCSSTALALAMHTHQVAVPVWRWRNQQAPVEGLLKRIAAEELVLVSTGGADWLPGSGQAIKENGGFRISGRKVFASGSPAGDLLMTMAIYDDPDEGPSVLQFPLSLKAEGVKILDNWRVMGMRGTGSNDVVIDGAFIPEEAIGGRRPPGVWSPPFHVAVVQILPLIYAVYVGVAEAARDMALQLVKGKRDNTDVQLLAGEMENELRTAQTALESAIAIAASAQPGPETTNEILIRRTIAGNAAVRTVDKAMDLVGGASYHRSLGLERLFRDVQAARFHPVTEKKQHLHAGRYALDLPVD
jgi:alkylation response protein AidB-like acyl-CoA dehydrogenase